jgi:toxin-antitoxin system PIN domain toxin
MIAVDTNLLVYAHREDSPWHDRAATRIAELAEGTAPWSIPAACLHEFLAIVSHPRIYRPPTPLPLALDQVNAWRESPSLVILTETDGYWEVLASLLQRSKAVGGAVHDARVVALCLHHGARELWSADRDFSRFSDLAFRNPLVV